MKFSQLRKIGDVVDTFSNKDAIFKAQEVDPSDLIYTEKAMVQWLKNIEKAISTDPEGEREIIEKATKDLSKLTQKQITDKTGKITTVWVGTGIKDEPKNKSNASDDEIQAIVDGAGSQSAKVRKLFKLGISDRKVVAELTGAHYSRVCQLHKEYVTKSGVVTEPSAVATGAAKEVVATKGPVVDVNTRWESYDLFLDMVVSGMSKSIIAFGTGGVGKTYTMEQVMKRHNQVEYDDVDAGHGLDTPGEYDYVKITGKSTPTAMFKALYEHNGKTIVFDDCDSVLKDETSINIFKGALDTSGGGGVTYDSGRDTKTAKKGHENQKGESIVPKRFKFNGRVIFISNLQPENMPQPLVDSRALAVDLSMTIDDTVERLRQISQIMPITDASGNKIEVSEADRTAAVDFINEYRNQIRPGKLNARTMGNITKIIHTSSGTNRDWKKMALTMLAS